MPGRCVFRDPFQVSHCTSRGLDNHNSITFPEVSTTRGAGPAGWRAMARYGLTS